MKISNLVVFPYVLLLTLYTLCMKGSILNSKLEIIYLYCINELMNFFDLVKDVRLYVNFIHLGNGNLLLLLPELLAANLVLFNICFNANYFAIYAITATFNYYSYIIIIFSINWICSYIYC